MLCICQKFISKCSIIIRLYFPGLHWSVMTFWIILQKTTFCSNKCEETLYNVVMGFVYCFCYINLQEGNTRYRLMIFYTLIITQNFGSLLLYVLLSDSVQLNRPWSIGATICIIGGTLIGGFKNNFHN